MNPICKCGETMHQHVMWSGIGFALLNKFSCPRRQIWNFWKHTSTCSSKEAKTGLTIL